MLLTVKSNNKTRDINNLLANSGKRTILNKNNGDSIIHLTLCASGELVHARGGCSWQGLA